MDLIILLHFSFLTFSCLGFGTKPKNVTKLQNQKNIVTKLCDEESYKIARWKIVEKFGGWSMVTYLVTMATMKESVVTRFTMEPKRYFGFHVNNGDTLAAVVTMATMVILWFLWLPWQP